MSFERSSQVVYSGRAWTSDPRHAGGRCAPGERAEPTRLEQTDNALEGRQPGGGRVAEGLVQVGDGSEHRRGLLPGDHGLPGEHGITEVSHHEHAPAVVEPAVQ